MRKRLNKLVFEIDYDNDEKIVLSLDNKYFDFIISYIDIIDEEDRKNLVFQEIDRHCKDFRESDYIVRYEVLEKNFDTEKIVIYYLKKDGLYKKFPEEDFKSGNVLCIIPSFFICRNFTEKTDFINIDIGEDYLVVSTYKNKKIKKIEKINLKETISHNYDYLVENFLQNEDDTVLVTGVGELRNPLMQKIFEKNEYKSNVIDYRIEKSLLLDKLNFLPDEYRKKIDKFLSEKMYLLFLLILIIFTLVAYVLILKIMYGYDKKLKEIEYKNSLIAKEIKDVKDEIKTLEEVISQRDLSINKTDKLSEMLEDIYNYMPDSTYVNTIKYDEEKNNLVVEGSTDSSLKISDLIYSFENSKIFTVSDYESITKSVGENYHFIINLKLKREDEKWN